MSTTENQYYLLETQGLSRALKKKCNRVIFAAALSSI